MPLSVKHFFSLIISAFEVEEAFHGNDSISNLSKNDCFILVLFQLKLGYINFFAS